MRRTAATVLVLTLLVSVLVMLLLDLGVALGAEPSLLPDGLLEGGDPRSEGAGPGIVGSPLLVLGAVVLLGVSTAVVTLIVARLARRD